MIRLLVKLGVWLDKRFPEKVVVTAAEYQALLVRMRTVEEHSAHIDAVKVVISEVKKLKDEYASLKTSLGINRVTESSPVSSAYLNDLPVGVYDGYER
jgi:hypothetical protein